MKILTKEHVHVQEDEQDEQNDNAPKEDEVRKKLNNAT